MRNPCGNLKYLLELKAEKVLLKYEMHSVSVKDGKVVANNTFDVTPEVVFDVNVMVNIRTNSVIIFIAAFQYLPQSS